MAFKPLAYVTNSSGNSVSIIDIESSNLLETIDVGTHPHGIAITPDGKYVFVANHLGGGSVSIIKTGTKLGSNRKISDIDLGTNPEAIAITPDGKYAYVTDTIDDKVYIIDIDKNSVEDPNGISVGSNPLDIAITPDGKYAYVTNNYSKFVSKIDISNENEVKSIPVNNFAAKGIAITPDGKYAYVVHRTSRYISLINTSDDSVEDLEIVAWLENIAITSDGNNAYVTNHVSNKVYVIETDGNTLSDPNGIFVGNDPDHLAITPDGKYVYVTRKSSKYLSVINISDDSVKEIDIGGKPYESHFIAIANIPEIGLADLSVNKTDYPDPVVRGEKLTYTVQVTNNGPDTATGVTLTDRIPVGEFFVSAETSQGSWSEEKGVVTCELGSLDNGDSATVTIVIIPTKGRSLANTATVEGNEEDPDPFNNTAIQYTTVITTPTTMCIEANRIYDSCFYEKPEKVVFSLSSNLLWWLEMIMLIYNIDIKKAFSCSIRETICNVVKVSDPNDQGYVDAQMQVNVVVYFEYLDLEKTFLLPVKTITLYAPDGSKITCEVKNASCEFDTMQDDAVYCTVDFTVMAKSKGLVQIEVPFYDYCNPEPCELNISGKWSTNYGEMILNQFSNKVTGTYTHDRGKIEGVLKGNVLTGTWSEAPTYSPSMDAGKMEFTFTDNSFAGKWGYGDAEPTSSWTGTRIIV